jgi:hypothetical protein
MNKRRLLAQMHAAYNIALLCSIRFHPDPDDWALIKEIRQRDLVPGFAYYNVMDAVEALKATGNITTIQLQDLQKWLMTLPDRKPEITERVNSFV